MAFSLITSWQIDGENMETVTDFIFLGSKVTVDSDCSHQFKRQLLLGSKSMTDLDSVLKTRDLTLRQSPSSRSYGFSSCHYGCESWTIKKWSIQTMVLEKTLEGPLDCKEFKPVNPKGNQPWIIIGKTDAEAETPIFWPPDMKSRLIGKHPDIGKDWRQEKGMTEDEMIG